MTIFSKIISGEIPSYKVAENDNFLAFLDINPLVPGHTLVIPKIETDYIFDLEDQVLSELHVFAKGVAIKIKAVIPCNRIGVTVIGLEASHAHIHLIPIDSLDDMNFSKNKVAISSEDLAAIAQKIREV